MRVASKTPLTLGNLIEKGIHDYPWISRRFLAVSCNWVLEHVPHFQDNNPGQAMLVYAQRNAKEMKTWEPLLIQEVGRYAVIQHTKKLYPKMPYDELYRRATSKSDLVKSALRGAPSCIPYSPVKTLQEVYEACQRNTLQWRNPLDFN